jgi:two-component system sensor histidine kinase/response regulator
MQSCMDTRFELQLESPFDPGEALARLDGDEQLLEELAQLFLEECPAILRKLDEAILRGDAQEVASQAHSMKGSVSNFAVSTATQAAFEIERMGKENDLRSAPQAFRRLEAILENLRPALTCLAEKIA